MNEEAEWGKEGQVVCEICLKLKQGYKAILRQNGTGTGVIFRAFWFLKSQGNFFANFSCHFERIALAKRLT